MEKKTDPDLWRRLRVGDRIRLVERPSEYLKWTTLHRDTKQAYSHLLHRRAPVKVYKVDSDGMPWIYFRSRQANGRMGHDYLMINHDGMVLVRPRLRSRRK